MMTHQQEELVVVGDLPAAVPAGVYEGGMPPHEARLPGVPRGRGGGHGGGLAGDSSGLLGGVEQF